jgi:hypothetical protein
MKWDWYLGWNFTVNRAKMQRVWLSEGLHVKPNSLCTKQGPVIVAAVLRCATGHSK